MGPLYRSAGFWITIGTVIGNLLIALNFKMEAGLIVALVGSDSAIIVYLVNRGVLVKALLASPEKALKAGAKGRAEF